MKYASILRQRGIGTLILVGTEKGGFMEIELESIKLDVKLKIVPAKRKNN